jgi:hypothetical protein
VTSGLSLFLQVNGASFRKVRGRPAGAPALGWTPRRGHLGGMSAENCQQIRALSETGRLRLRVTDEGHLPIRVTLVTFFLGYVRLVA